MVRKPETPWTEILWNILAIALVALVALLFVLLALSAAGGE